MSLLVCGATQTLRGGGRGAAFQVACVSWNRKGWFCCKRHLSRRQASGRLTGCLCQGLSHKQRHEGGLSKAGRLAASRATGAAAAPLCAAPPSAGPRAPHCVGRGAEPGFISCSRSASCMPGLNPHGLGQSKTPVLMERTSGGHRLLRSVLVSATGERARGRGDGRRRPEFAAPYFCFRVCKMGCREYSWKEKGAEGWAWGGPPGAGSWLKCQPELENTRPCTRTQGWAGLGWITPAAWEVSTGLGRQRAPLRCGRPSPHRFEDESSPPPPPASLHFPGGPRLSPGLWSPSLARNL